jgi:hypothetical protein
VNAKFKKFVQLNENDYISFTVTCPSSVVLRLIFPTRLSLDHRIGDQCVLMFKRTGRRGKDEYKISDFVRDKDGEVSHEVAGRCQEQPAHPLRRIGSWHRQRIPLP